MFAHKNAASGNRAAFLCLESQRRVSSVMLIRLVS
ncbi:hypothetical protein SVI_2271 [Shewanella violacea DSS12]|uniref:Uncharacterized protein n=1 Tax=Shewanella violacea (strain JCM 10179 / CIP 106290 / LMG 19151 / DSS12) TaxID=637905 RepID=D4ZKP3_SHEVD|nr:hypothetical protein SVI_2271 [Shewanella violacea DSS12]